MRSCGFVTISPERMVSFASDLRLDHDPVAAVLSIGDAPRVSLISMPNGANTIFIMDDRREHE